MPRASTTEADLAARRTEILAAAAAEIAASGYAGATVRRIAARAGIAEGTIYNYFSGKEELVLGLLDRLDAGQRAKLPLGTRSPDDPRSIVEAYLEHRLSLLWRQRRLLVALLPHLLVQPELRARFRDRVLLPERDRGAAFLERLGERGRIRPVSPERVAEVVTGATLGLIVQRLLEGATEPPPKKLVASLVDLVLDGLAIEEPATVPR